MRAIPPNCPVTVMRKDHIGAILVHICPNCRIEILESELLDKGETVYWVLKCSRCGAKWIRGVAHNGMIQQLIKEYKQYKTLEELILNDHES